MLIFVSELELLYIMYRDLMYRFEILLFFFCSWFYHLVFVEKFLTHSKYIIAENHAHLNLILRKYVNENILKAVR